MDKQYIKSRNTKKRLKTARGRKISSTHWLKRHINDPYVLKAKEENYRSRAAFKLIEIDDRFKLIERSKYIIDLGSAPGSWLQVLKKRAHSGSVIVGIDLKEISPLTNIHFIQGDFLEQKYFDKIVNLVSKADLVISDMAANSCGESYTDHCKIAELVLNALSLAGHILKPNGAFVTKILSGPSEEEIAVKLKKSFRKIYRMKPKASYDDSSEFFIIGLGFKKPLKDSLDLIQF